MKHAVVLGASGGIGYALTMELAKRGVKVTAFARDREKLNRLFTTNAQITISSGDALNEANLYDVIESEAIVFHALNFPYEEWHNTQMNVIQKIIKVAEEKRAKVVLADNIYAYGIQRNPVSENKVKQPIAKKGEIRLQMEQELLKSKVPVIIAHLPDLFGPHATNTLLHETLKGAIKGKKANYIGRADLVREFLYTSDGAEQMIDLAMKDNRFNQNWNIPGQLIKGDDLFKHIKEVTNTEKGFRVVSKAMIQFLGLFNSQMRELVEMMYLNETPVHLDGTKIGSELKSITHTSFKEGLMETVKSMKAIEENR